MRPSGSYDIKTGWKWCLRCNSYLPVSEFHTSQAKCKTCRAAEDKGRSRPSNSETLTSQQSHYKRHLRARYGTMSEEDVQFWCEQIFNQSTRCYFCNLPESQRQRLHNRNMGWKIPGVKSRFALHHQNGNPSDNRRVNIIITCSTCHQLWHSLIRPTILAVRTIAYKRIDAAIGRQAWWRVPLPKNGGGVNRDK